MRGASFGFVIDSVLSPILDAELSPSEEITGSLAWIGDASVFASRGPSLTPPVLIFIRQQTISIRSCPKTRDPDSFRAVWEILRIRELFLVL
jgi:hypothetical protein